MNLSYSQIKHALSLDQDGLDAYAEELGMSLGELNEHLDLAEQGVGLNDGQYDSLYNKPQLSNEYKELEKMIVLLGDTISEKQWGLFADQARGLPANELHSMLNDDRFIGMYSYLSEICAERGIY